MFILINYTIGKIPLDKFKIILYSEYIKKKELFFFTYYKLNYNYEKNTYRSFNLSRIVRRRIKIEGRIYTQLSPKIVSKGPARFLYS